MENIKAAEAASNSTGGTAAGQTANSNGGANPDPSAAPNPKLGMAPLSSELAAAVASNNVPAENHQLSNPPPPDPPQPTNPQNARTSTPPTVDPPRPDPIVTDLAQTPTIQVPSGLKEVPRGNDPSPSLPDSTTLPPDPTPTIGQTEQPHPPDPGPAPSDCPLANPPAVIGSHPPKADNTSEEVN